MSSSFAVADLAGLDAARLRAAGTTPVSFALIREAGRIDCAGNAGRGRADGSCRFTENRGFSDLLAARGMRRPNVEQAYGLTMVGATRGLLDALHANRYPMPKVDDYIAMSAVGVTPRYIRDLAAAGYRPDDSKRLIEFAAIGVTPAYLGSLARAGYANLPQEDVVQLAALDIDPEFIKGFERIGYRNLPIDTLVQLKALDVTPRIRPPARGAGHQGAVGRAIGQAARHRLRAVGPLAGPPPVSLQTATTICRKTATSADCRSRAPAVARHTGLTRGSTMFLLRHRRALLAGIALMAPLPAAAQTSPAADPAAADPAVAPAPVSAPAGSRRVFTVADFTRFAPKTAYDMVHPGPRLHADQRDVRRARPRPGVGECADQRQAHRQQKL